MSPRCSQSCSLPKSTELRPVWSIYQTVVDMMNPLAFEIDPVTGPLVIQVLELVVSGIYSRVD